MLVTLQRYLGLAATATAIAAVAVLSRTNWRRRLGDAIGLALTAVPMTVWLAITSQTYTRRGPITFEENFSRFSVSVLEWFVGPTSRKADVGAEQVVLWAAIAALTATALFFTRRDPSTAKEATQPEEARQVAWPYVRVLLLYGLLYVLALFGSASMAYFNKLEGRFILPLFVPLMALPVIAADALVQAARRSGRMQISYALAIIGGLAVMGLGATLLRATYPAVMESRGRGVVGGENSFNNETWYENPAVRYWKDHTPTGTFVLFSNEPDGVAFHTWHAVEPAPRRISGPYGKDVMPVEDFTDELFGQGLEAYLIWIEPSSYDYYYAPQELEAIAEMETQMQDEGGSVYRLSPKGEN
jgi:hypothetical protein